MGRHSWLTSDDETGIVCRSLRIPLPLLDAVNGAIGLLTFSWNWESFGDLTPQECADMASEMWNEYLVSGGCMIGQFNWYLTADLPSNCLPCDGSSYDRIDYPLLYAALDAVFIDDEDTFTIPAIADRFVLSIGSGTMGSTGGEQTHQLTVDEMPEHTHTIPYQSCFPIGELLENCVVGGILTQQTGATGGDEAHNNMPPYIRLRPGVIAK